MDHRWLRPIGAWVGTAMIGALLVVVTAVSPASAADSCGSGWHKQSDGLLSGTSTASSGGRTARATINGYVRYCTRERTAAPDQKNQMIIVGYPQDVVSKGSVSGAHTRVCVNQAIAVHFNWKITSVSVGVGLSGPTAGGTLSGDTWTRSRSSCSGTAPSATWKQTPLRISANNGICNYIGLAWAAACYAGPFVTKIVVTTETTVRYRKANGSTVGFSARQVETDYPN